MADVLPCGWCRAPVRVPDDWPVDFAVCAACSADDGDLDDAAADELLERLGRGQPHRAPGGPVSAPRALGPASARPAAEPQNADKAALSPKRRSRDVENEEYSAALERLVRRYGRRVAEGDPGDLARMLEVRDAFDEAVADAARGLHATGYWSWTDIGSVTGTTRQAAREKWGRAS